MVLACVAGYEAARAHLDQAEAVGGHEAQGRTLSMWLEIGPKTAWRSKKKLIALALIAGLLAVGTAVALVVVEIHKVADVFFTIKAPEEPVEITPVRIDLGELDPGEYFSAAGAASAAVRESGWKARFIVAFANEERDAQLFDWCYVDVQGKDDELWGTIDFLDTQSYVEVELPEGSYHLTVRVYGKVSDELSTFVPLGPYEFKVQAGVWKYPSS